MFFLVLRVRKFQVGAIGAVQHDYAGFVPSPSYIDNLVTVLRAQVFGSVRTVVSSRFYLL